MVSLKLTLQQLYTEALEPCKSPTKKPLGDYQFRVKIYLGRSWQSLNRTQQTSEKKFTIMNFFMSYMNLEPILIPQVKMSIKLHLWL